MKMGVDYLLSGEEVVAVWDEGEREREEVAVIHTESRCPKFPVCDEDADDLGGSSAVQLADAAFVTQILSIYVVCCSEPKKIV